MPRSIDFAVLAEAHHASLWRYLRYLGCDRALADDLVQETFLRVVEKPFEWRGDREALQYLRTVARRQFLMHIRRSKFITTTDELDAADEAWERGAGDDAEARQSALQECLQTVTGKARRALQLQYREGRSGEQIADELGISHSSLRVMVHRARQALRRCITKKLDLTDS